MTKKISAQDRALARIQRIQEQICAIDHVCSGHLHKRMKVCGTPGCRCAKDPAMRHGPYYQWSRQEQGRQVNSVLSPQEARRFERAIKNYRRVQRLLARWERESAHAIRAITDSTREKKGT